MEYKITHKELTCINILIKILKEAIERNTFNSEEVKKIYITIDKLNERNTKYETC